MKKAFIILIANIYLLVFSGFSVNIHFCDDQLDSFTFIGSEPNCGCDESKNDGCCEDQHFYFKDNTDHQLTEVTEKNPELVFVVLPTFTFVQSFQSLAHISVALEKDSKPPGSFKYRKHILLNKFTC